MHTQAKESKKRDMKKKEESKKEEVEVSKKGVEKKLTRKSKNPPPSESTDWSSDEEDESEDLWETDDNDEEEEEEDLEDISMEEDDEDEIEEDEDEEIIPENIVKRTRRHKNKNKNKKSYDEEDDVDEEEEEEEYMKRRKNKAVVKREKKSRKYEEEEEEEEDVDDEEKVHKKKSKKQNFLVFNIAAAQEGDEEEGFEDYDEWTDEENSDMEDNNYASDDEKIFMKGLYEHIEEPPEIIKKQEEQNEKEAKKGKKGQKDRKGKNESKLEKGKKNELPEEDKKAQIKVEEEYLQLLETKKNLVTELKKRPNKIYEKALKECKEDIKKLVQEGRSENVKIYHELVRSEKDKMNEYRYFKKHLSHQEQMKIIEDYKHVQKQNNFQRPYRIRILESNISPQLKEIALHKIDQLRDMIPGDPEYHKLKTWIDTFMKIPFGIYKSIDINIEKDGIDSCNEYMTKAQQILDECTYGLEESKLQIMQMVGQWLTNPAAMGTAIAIKGSPGTGKTSLIKEGVSKILGREFVFIPLGGAGDSSYLEGHSYTYEGSMWGKIVQTLIDCKCMNPVIYFDELDKVSETPRGEEIIGVLTHLTDTSQNMEFHDKYFAEIREFDLSKCLFIFSYNDESKINPILLNRMYTIQTKGYTTDEKMVIARKYLLPKIAKQVNFQTDDIVLKDDILRNIITDERYSRKEDGVRNLKRSLEIIYTKLNLYRVMNKDNQFFEKYKQIPQNIDFPHTLSNKDLELLIKQNDYLSPSYLAMYT